MAAGLAVVPLAVACTSCIVEWRAGRLDFLLLLLWSEWNREPDHT
jgi:hypothetical protein